MGSADLAPGVVRDDDAPGRPRAQSLVLLACMGAGFTTLIDGASMAYIAPSVGETLGASTAGVQWFLAAFSLTFGLGLAPAGRLGDAYGRRMLFIIGLGLFLTGCAFAAAAGETWMLILGRLIQGLGAGVLSAQVLGIIQDTYSGTARVRAFAGYTAAGAAAAVAGPLLSALLLEVVGEPAWRLVLLLPFLAGIGTLWVAWRHLPRDAKRSAAVDLDIPGVLLLGALTVTVTLPVVDPGVGTGVLTALVAASIVLVMLLCWWEVTYRRRGRLPVFAPELLRSRSYMVTNAAALLWFGSILAFSTVLVMYFMAATDLSAFLIAAAGIPGAAARFLGARLSSRLFSRWGATVFPAALSGQVVALAVFVVVSYSVETMALFWISAAVLVVLGFFSGMTEPTVRAVALAEMGPHLRGVAASFLQLTQRLAATFLIALVSGLLLSAGLNAGTGSLRIATLVCLSASAVACFLALLVPPLSTSRPAASAKQSQ